MLEQTGQVLESGAGRARVRLGGQTGCPACDAGQGCGAGLFGRLLRRRPVELDLQDDFATPVGASVQVGLPEALLLRLAWRCYGLPLLAGLAGALLSHQMVDVGAPPALRDAVSLAGGLLAAGLAWRWAIRRPAEALARWPVKLLGVTPGRNACPGTSSARQGVTNQRMERKNPT